MRKAELLMVDGVIHLPGGEVVQGWLAVADGVVDGIGDTGTPPADAVVDCSGKWLLPGVVDIHVHFRDPGFTHKEDFVSGSAAAAAGGVTTVVDMPNTEGGVVTAADVARKLAVIEGRSHVDYGLYAELADSAEHIDDLCAAGIAGLKWMFGDESAIGRVAVRDALAGAARAGLLVGVHAEDREWYVELERSLRAQGRTDARAHGEARPPFVEALAIVQAATVAEEVGCRLHVHHLSSARALASADTLRGDREVPLTVEVCPHHLFLTQDDLDRVGPRGRVNPPLRDRNDVAALWSGIAAGAVDCIASDHAPHAATEREVESIWDAPSGLIGVETLLPLLLEEVRGERLSTGQLTRLTAETPASLVGLEHRKGALMPGRDADVVIVDPDRETVVASASLHSKHPQTPFEGRRSRGAIESVYLRGAQVARGGVVERERRGTHVPSRHRAQSGAGATGARSR